MQVRLIMKVRDESHIIRETLDNWSQYCTAAHVYDDCSEDGTAEICRSHPLVVEVVSSNLFDPNRERSERFNRQAVLASAQRFLGKDDWLVYADGDEHLFDFPLGVLERSDVDVVACKSYDAYITPEDATCGWKMRRPWVGPGWEFAPYFYRNRPWLKFSQPDQRNLQMTSRERLRIEGNVLHWGKGISVEHWERKCRYYSDVFGPKYQAKWEGRKGKAVQIDWKSVYGNPLVRWEDVRAGTVETFPRHNAPIVK